MHTITIYNNTVHNGKQKLGIDHFCRIVQEHSITGLREEPIPDNVKWIAECGKNAVYVLELKPELRQVLWVDGGYEDEEGDWVGGDAEVHTIATPYVIVMVRFYNGQPNVVEVYYRNSPLKSLDDWLCNANLKNVTAIGMRRGYLCLDGLSIKGLKRTEDILNEIVNHLWASEFNDEFSWNNFREFAGDGDKRLSTIQRWEAESKKDPEFVLGVKWTAAGVTVRQLIQNSLAAPATNGSQLGSMVLLHGK